MGVCLHEIIHKLAGTGVFEPAEDLFGAGTSLAGAGSTVVGLVSDAVTAVAEPTASGPVAAGLAIAVVGLADTMGALMAFSWFLETSLLKGFSTAHGISTAFGSLRSPVIHVGVRVTQEFVTMGIFIQPSIVTMQADRGGPGADIVRKS